jgi:hypothetical protein
MTKPSIGRPSYASVVATLALIVALGGTATAATGGTFVIGRSNYASSTTGLANSAGTPLSLTAGQGKAPLIVNSSALVRNLNADKLGGLSASSFQRALHTACPSGHVLAGFTASGGLSCATATPGQKGDSGAPGAPGTPGAPGAKGDPGPATPGAGVYEEFPDASLISADQLVGYFKLPAGSWSVSLYSNISDNDGATEDTDSAGDVYFVPSEKTVVCALTTSDNFVYYVVTTVHSQFVPFSANVNTWTLLNFTQAINAPVGTLLTLKCSVQELNGADASAYARIAIHGTRMTAVQTSGFANGHL